MRRIDLADLLAATGLALLAVGLGMVYLPLALIVTGAIVLALGIVGSR